MHVRNGRQRRYELSEKGREALARYRQSEKCRTAKRATEARRRARKLSGFDGDPEVTRFIRECPPGFEVDHIIPLKGEVVCGLHILSNLEYLDPDSNRQKSNKLLPQYESGELFCIWTPKSS